MHHWEILSKPDVRKKNTTFFSGSGRTGGCVNPPKILCGGFPPPPKFQGRRKIGEQNEEKEKKKKSSKILHIGSKQMGQNRWVFEGATLNPKIFVPVPIKIFELPPPLPISIRYMCTLQLFLLVYTYMWINKVFQSSISLRIEHKPSPLIDAIVSSPLPQVTFLLSSQIPWLSVRTTFYKVLSHILRYDPLLSECSEIWKKKIKVKLNMTTWVKH